MKKILIATIVPFWELKTGAHQRIYSIVNTLQSNGEQVRVFFPAATDGDVQRKVLRLGIDVDFVRPNQRPRSTQESFGRRFAWHLAGTRHAIDKILRPKGTGETSVGAAGVSVTGQRLKDFRWAWASDLFNDAVADYSPDVIICEYITTAYLVQGLPERIRLKTHCMVDTHDLLSERQSQFSESGHRHWIDVSRDQEAEALNVFDTIIAIESNEAVQMQMMAPQKRVILVGHKPGPALSRDATNNKGSDQAFIKSEDLAGISISRDNATKKLAKDSTGKLKSNNHDTSLKVGYLGSANASNVDAVVTFLSSVASSLTAEEGLTFLIAGDVCDALQRDVISDDRALRNVCLIGPVASVSDFYDQVDVVINPVGYGTGLKIKSVEAIASGKPLLVTKAGWSGAVVDGVVVVSEVVEMLEVLKGWASDPDAYALSRRGAESSSEEFRDAHRPLLELLREIPTVTK